MSDSISPVYQEYFYPNTGFSHYDVQAAKAKLAKAGYKDTNRNCKVNFPERGDDIFLELILINLWENEEEVIEMEFDKVIKDRVSIRKYQKRNIDNSQLNYILECGHAAPTAGNVQPWEFIVVRDVVMKRKIVDTTYVGNQKNASKHQEWLMDAPVFIVVCANKDSIVAKYGEESMKKLIYLDCSASVENMLLAAVNLNLGSCYISGFRENELSQVLELPSSLEVIAFIPIGYVEDTAMRRVKRPLKEVVHIDFYNN